MRRGWRFCCVCEVCGPIELYHLKLRANKASLGIEDTDSHLVEDAVKYIIFLVDADRLFDTALGMYDFSLVLMIAQHAQKVRTLYISG